MGVVGVMRVLGLMPVGLECLRQGKHGKSQLLYQLAMGDYNTFKPELSKFDWLSKDPAEVDKYVEDPKCGFLVTNQQCLDHLSGLGEALWHTSMQTSTRSPKIPLFVSSAVTKILSAKIQLSSRQVCVGYPIVYMI